MSLLARRSNMFDSASPKTWAEIQSAVRSGKAQKYFKINDQFTVRFNNTDYVFDIKGFDHDTPINPNYTHSMTLVMNKCWDTPIQFDAPEAAFYLDPDVYPNGINAGTYQFTWNYAIESMVNGIYQFTLTNDVPANGQIVIGTTSSSRSLLDCKISTYATPSSTTVIENNIVITQGVEGVGINLGTINDATKTSTVNAAQRIMWGSSNWLESGMRQWMNSSGKGWWEPKTGFDRPTSNATSDGMLTGLNSEFLSVVGEVEKKTQRSVCDNYGIDSSIEKFFLLSRPEVYMGVERSTDGSDGTVYDGFGFGYSDLTAPGAGADYNRIKYRGSSVSNWWLRTPYVSNASRVRSSITTGALNSGSAYSSYGVVPACVIC